MIYYLPTIRSTDEGFENIGDLAGKTRALFIDKLELDFSRCGFFDANMASPLAVVLARVADNLNSIEIVNVLPEIERILQKNRFLVNYGYNALEDTNLTTIPFRRIQLSEKGRFEDYLQKYLKGKGIPTMTEGLGYRFKQSIFEIYQNAVSHSESSLGVFVCGQFYPKLQRLDLTIADAGIGIRSTVRKYLKNRVSSVFAIKWALMERNTTKTGAQPGGVGLKFLKDFISLNEGRLQITSRQGYYEFNDGQDNFIKINSDFPGTAVNLEINTSDTKSYDLDSKISPMDIF